MNIHCAASIQLVLSFRLQSLKLSGLTMVAIKAFLGGKVFYLLLIGFAAGVAIITITTVALVGKPEDTSEKNLQSTNQIEADDSFFCERLK